MQYIAVSEYAEKHRVSKRAVYNWINSGRVAWALGESSSILMVADAPPKPSGRQRGRPKKRANNTGQVAREFCLIVNLIKWQFPIIIKRIMAKINGKKKAEIAEIIEKEFATLADIEKTARLIAAEMADKKKPVE